MDFAEEFGIDCQCSNWPEECREKATEEDFLCDTCRDGCARLTFQLFGSERVASHSKWAVWESQRAPAAPGAAHD